MKQYNIDNTRATTLENQMEGMRMADKIALYDCLDCLPDTYQATRTAPSATNKVRNHK